MASTPRPIRWLHLSDLHYGCPGKILWEQVEREFFDDVAYWVEKLGPPDLLLFTGDLAYSGKAEEYDAVEAFLDDLVARLTSLGGSKPIVLTVPGNHDVAWPSTRRDRLQYRILHDFDGTIDDPEVAELHRELWDDRDASFVEPLFPGYRVFFEQRIRPQLEARANSVHFSHFPCDFTAEIEPDGAFPLAVVGLNSTWLQYTGGDFDGKLLIPHEQYRAALAPKDAKPYEVFDRVDGALLLMHQPPSWLSPRAAKIFDGQIFSPKHFTACLFGHLHAANGSESRAAGGLPKVFLQSPSLFGLEKWGRSAEDRAFGYTWGQLSEDGELRIWPRESTRRHDGVWSFGHDRGFHEGPDGVLIRVGRSTREPVPASRRGIDRRGYLEWVYAETGSLEIRGVVSDESSDALCPPIENLYTPLRCRSLGFSEKVSGDPVSGMAERMLHGDTVELKTLLPGARRLLIEGEPGAGKTTFLRFVASMLARDGLGLRCPDGPSWRAAFLGLADADEPPMPVFLRLAGLVRLLSPGGEDALPDDRSRLLDLLEVSLSNHPSTFDRELWRDELASGRAWLLLDGLDEVADLDLRERLFAITRDAVEHWRATVVVASRPFQTEALSAMGFRVATVEPFGQQEIETFLDYWTGALRRQDAIRADRGHKGSYLQRLHEAILRRPRIRAMARNPVMLTCLCVVHWNRGELPEVRSKVYEAVIRWLLHARSELRSTVFGLEPDFAERTLSTLALAAMTSAEGKQSLLGLDSAVDAVLPSFERARPESSDAERRALARSWLLFECDGSGVVEEVAGSQIRFWHLTFQEYLAALELSRESFEEWWVVLEDRLSDAQWRETTELFATCLYDSRHAKEVDRLLKRLLSRGDDSRDLGTEARVVGIIGRLLEPLEVCGYEPSPALRSAYAQARERAMGIFTREGAALVPVKDRIAAAEALGRGGDPRLRESGHFLLVDGVDWKLGKFPVTVEEYQQFVDTDRGYEDARWWSSEGWRQKEENRWSEPGSWAQQLETPNRPVVSVSWWEAEAYCRWLSESRQATIRLPTQAEWELAATHPDGPYPWGSAEPDEERVNFRRDVGAATPVGIYPSGAGPYGHCDLGGNVWEWCSDRLEREEAKRVGADVAYPLRGGCWVNPAEDLRSAVRGRDRPEDRSDGVGFRVVCAPAS